MVVSHNEGPPSPAGPPSGGGTPAEGETPTGDREMRCESCGVRMFTSQAPDLVAAGYRCPRCLGRPQLVGGGHEFAYPRVVPHLGTV